MQKRFPVTDRIQRHSPRRYFERPKYPIGAPVTNQCVLQHCLTVDGVVLVVRRDASSPENDALSETTVFGGQKWNISSSLMNAIAVSED